MTPEDEFLLPPEAGRLVTLGSLGVRFMLGGAQTGGRFALVEHPLPAHALGAPMHTHHDEDEFSYVLEGIVGVQIGDEVLSAAPGTLVKKPRGVPHAFWNPGPSPARMLELISPAGFENYFGSLAELYSAGSPDPARATELQRQYHVDMDLSSIQRLIQTHGLSL